MYRSGEILFINAYDLITKEEGTRKIVKYYKNWDNVDGCVYLADHDEIEKNDFDLSVSKYVNKKSVW